MWLCAYADADGTCFPSVSRLAEDCGMTSRTVINKLRKLEELGFLERTRRKKEGSKENAVNEYQLLIVGSEPNSLPRSKPNSSGSERNDMGGSERGSQELKPILTKPLNSRESTPAQTAEDFFTNEETQISFVAFMVS